MKPFSRPFVLVLWIVSFLAGGCSSPQGAYRDPVTYSFEANAPSSSAAPSELQDAKEKAAEGSRKIRAWEERNLW